MKKMTCKNIGGMCGAEITGETPEEMMEAGKKHVHDAAEGGDEAHGELVEKMKNMSEEDFTTWQKGFKEKFEAAAEV